MMIDTPRRLPIRLAIASLGLGLGLGAALPLHAEEDSIPFGEARLFFELNDSDHDLGFHGSIDGEGWKYLSIENPDERLILTLTPRGRLRNQGLTQLMFESEEPSIDELAPAVFFARFPEGEYDIEAITSDGEEMEGTPVVSHLLPDRPRNVRVNGMPSSECGTPEVPTVSAPVVVTWDPVTQSHPTIGRQGAATVARYQVFAEQRVHAGMKFSLDLPPTMTQYQIAPELLALGDPEYKFEIQVREENGNQTAVEHCFNLQP